MRLKKICLFVAAIFLALPVAADAYDEAGQQSITILHTNSANNTLQACGCPGNPFGGLAQRAYLIERFRKNTAGVLVIDSGDLFGTGDSDFARRKSEILLEAYRRMGYSAVAIGDQEFAYGPQYLKDLIAARTLPFISSNIYDAATGHLLTYPYRYYSIAGIRVAVIAYASPRAFFFTPAKNKEGIDVREDQAKLQQQISYLRSRADLLVLVTHQGLDRDRELAGKVTGVDVIIGGHSQDLTLQPEKAGDTLIVQAGKEGEYLGELTFFFEQGRITGHSYNLNPLTEQIPADARVAALIKEWDDLVAREMEKSPIKLPETHQVQVVWDHYPVAGTCRECHTEVHAAWEKTPHGRAIESLKASGRLNNPECLYCHTTGYGRVNGFKTMGKTPQLAGVQCASCHDVQPEHFKTPTAQNVVTPTDTRLCLSCHTVDKSPGFNHGEYLQKVHGDTVTQSE